MRAPSPVIEPPAAADRCAGREGGPPTSVDQLRRRDHVLAARPAGQLLHTAHLGGSRHEPRANCSDSIGAVHQKQRIAPAESAELRVDQQDVVVGVRGPATTCAEGRSERTRSVDVLTAGVLAAGTRRCGPRSHRGRKRNDGLRSPPKNHRTGGGQGRASSDPELGGIAGCLQPPHQFSGDARWAVQASTRASGCRHTRTGAARGQPAS